MAPAHPVMAQERELRFDRLTPGDLEPYVQGILDSAAARLERLLAMKGPRTVANTLRPYDDYRIAINRARVVSFIQFVHSDSAIRAAAARAEDRLDAFNRLRRTDRRVYEMLLAVDTVNADPEIRFWLRRELQDFRRESVDRDSVVRARADSLQRELNRLGQLWTENSRRDTITVAFDSLALDGMTAPWMAARARAPDGKLLVTGEELRNVISQATRSATRERAMMMHMRLRRNHFVLDTLLRTRYALATLLGDRSWAEYQLHSTMAGSPERVRAFLDEVRRVTEPATRRLIETRLADLSGADSLESKAIALHDLAYRSDDAGTGTGVGSGFGIAIRQYLPYDRVRDGMLDLAREFLGLEFRPAPDLPVWDPTVEPYRVFEDGKLVARVYLDVHWRPGRSTIGAATHNWRIGVRDRATLEAAITGGMVRAFPGEPALLGPRPMETLFHEFGHLLHAIIAVRPWFASSGLPDDFDFREVPSTLFAEWARDPAVVARFARHYQTGAPAPRELLERLRNVQAAGPGFMAQWMARMSLDLHDRPPGDMHGVIRQAFEETLPPGLPVRIALPTGDFHVETTFPHLGNGYDAAYYTYLWSSAISQDLLTRFDRGLLDPVAITSYRQHILEPGRSRSADDLIQGFLGRPFNLDAWAKSVAPRPPS